MPGREVCRWHSKSPADKAKRREMGSRGGKKKPAPLPTISPLVETKGVAELNLETAEGLRTFLAHALHALGRLAFDTRTANAIGQLVTAQRTVVVAGDFEERLIALEAVRDQRPLRAV
jgi:hypothetical protein